MKAERLGLHVATLPKNPHSVALNMQDVEMAAAFSTTWYNDSVAVWQKINHENWCLMERALVSHRAHHGERKASGAAKKGQK